jgi:hypothetical protein
VQTRGPKQAPTSHGAVQRFELFHGLAVGVGLAALRCGGVGSPAYVWRGD